MFIVFLLMLGLPLHADNYDDGKKMAQNYLNNPTEKDILQKSLAEIKAQNPQSQPIESLTEKNCIFGSKITEDSRSNVYIFLSFSVPEKTWIEISNEAVQHNGIIVLRGLPNNSFKELARSLYALRLKGVKATIQVDPLLYRKYNIEKVPCFVQIHPTGFDKLSGNVSLAFALNKMSKSISTK